MNVDMPKTAEQIVREREALFESWLFESGRKMILNPPSKLAEMGLIIGMYDNYAGATHEDDKKKRSGHAARFRELTGGYEIEDFLAYMERRNKELQAQE
jgi:hypothetical protein